MTIRKFTFRIIAGTLVLSLLSAGAVPAKTTCEGACCCHSNSRIELPASTTISESSYHTRNFGGILNVSHNDHKYTSFFKTYHPDPGCLEGIVSASCDMEPLRALKAIQSSVSAVPRAERSLPALSTLVSSEMGLNAHQIFVIPKSHLMAVKGIPIPLYLQTLSLLC